MASEEEVRAQCLSIVSEMAPNKDATAEADSQLIEDLGYHSLSLLELAFALEDEYDLPPIDEETGRTIKKVSDVQDYVVNGLGDRVSA